MTSKQRKKIENEFYNYEANQNPLWKTVFDNTIKKFKWEREEQVIQMKFVDKKQQYNICGVLKIPRRTYYLYLNRIYETAFMWAKELNLL